MILQPLTILEIWTVNENPYTLFLNQLFSKQEIVLIDALTKLEFNIPRFCYYENLKVAGNCRMCLVEDLKAAKPIVSCATNVVPDLNVFLDTMRVKKARESVMEFLLINHPLDCPIRDQGGECDLQDLALVYGSDHGRFYDYKRNVENKNCGSIVKTIMNRCIQCTRCVRFANDIAGFFKFGATGRGTKFEIGSYVEKFLETELSGNLVDIRPVGALTSKAYTFAARPWELKKLTTLNIFDDELQVIRADVKENELLRIVPLKNDSFLNNWITNRVRYSYEGLNKIRSLELPQVLGIITQWQTFLSSFSLFCFAAYNKALIYFPRLTVFDNTLSNQDLLLVKFMVNTLSFNYNKSSLHLNCLPQSYNQIFLSSGADINYCILNLDLEYYAPLLYIMLQQSQIFSRVIFWYSKAIPVNDLFIFISGSVLLLKTLFRSKFWYSLLRVSPIIFILSSLKIFDKLIYFMTNYLVSNFFLIPIFNGASERAKAALSIFSKTHNQNKILFLSNFNYTLVGPTTFLKEFNFIELIQSTHKNNSIENVFFIPVPTVYEQSNLKFFDSAYKSFISSKIVVTLLKTAQNVFKSFLNVLTESVLFFTEILNFFSEFRLILLNNADISMSIFFYWNTFERFVKSNYLNAYLLTKNSLSIRTLEIKHIYL